MTAKLLQTLGVVFVLSLVGASIFGFMVLKDRVRVVFAADATATGPDPTALLRDDVQTVAREVAALQQALAANFEQLATALEERANARHVDVLLLQQSLATSSTKLAALAQQSEGLRLQLAALPSTIVAAMASNGSVPVQAPLTVAAAGVVPKVTKQPPAVVAEPSAPEPPVTTATPPVPAPKKGGSFLSFQVPGVAFRFDALQDYTIVPELSRVGFDAKSTLHDFSGVTSQVRGSFRADFDDPAGAWSGEVAAVAASLLTGVDGRDEAMREHLATKDHADLRFVLERFTPSANGVDVEKQTVKGDLAGTMTIRGQSKPFTLPVALEVDPQKRVVITGQTKLKLSDYGVPVPSQLGMINMQDEVAVWVALRARVQAGASK